MSLKINKIEKELYKLSNCDPSEDFIAIGIELTPEGYGNHSGIIISLNKKITLFHFDGVVKIEDNLDIDSWYFVKKLEIFEGEDDFIVNFKAHCEIVCEEANPEFGFLFDGSYYSSDGIYYTKNEINDITTCVGFCIKIIKGYLYNHNDYLQLSDWDGNSLDEYKIKNLDFYEHQLKKLEKEYPERIEEIKKNYLKRILPTELTSSGFFSDLPIRKNQIDTINTAIERFLIVKRLI